MQLCQSMSHYESRSRRSSRSSIYVMRQSVNRELGICLNSMDSTLRADLHGLDGPLKSWANSARRSTRRVV
jgi:hypothetical protein